MQEKLEWPLDQKAYKKALDKKTYTLWSRKEKAHLKKYASIKSVKELAKELGKTESAVSSQIYLMKKKKQNYSSSSIWTKAEEAYVVENYGKKKNAEIGKKLGRTAVAVQLRYSVIKRSGRLSEYLKTQQMTTNLETPKGKVKALHKKAPERRIVKAPEKQIDKIQIFTVTFTIINTIILSWILFSSYIH